jgi:hypothetical protein
MSPGPPGVAQLERSASGLGSESKALLSLYWKRNVSRQVPCGSADRGPRFRHAIDATMRPRKISGCTCNFRVDLLNEFLQAPILLCFPPDPETMPKQKKHDSDEDDVAPPGPDHTARFFENTPPL